MFCHQMFWVPLCVSWWNQDGVMFSTLLVICEGNPLVSNGFPSQRTSNKGSVFALLFSHVSYWTNCWVASKLICHDITVLLVSLLNHQLVIHEIHMRAILLEMFQILINKYVCYNGVTFSNIHFRNLSYYISNKIAKKLENSIWIYWITNGIFILIYLWCQLSPVQNMCSLGVCRVHSVYVPQPMRDDVTL